MQDLVGMGRMPFGQNLIVGSVEIQVHREDRTNASELLKDLEPYRERSGDSTQGRSEISMEKRFYSLTLIMLGVVSILGAVGRFAPQAPTEIVVVGTVHAATVQPAHSASYP